MRSNYKRLGSCIRPIDVRNSEGREDGLLGLSVQKTFVQSKANTIGTNFRNYKVVKRNQFSYTADTSRREDKIAIALLDQWDEALVSPIYTVFEIIDPEELLPEYLMMWFRRPEFDRYARYMSHGSVRELFGWEEMTNVELPVPPPEQQREIVADYRSVVERIRLNERLNEKLEETAQALYRHWFVDFEFPMTAEQAHSLGKPELEGLPYKTSGGELVYNETLDQEIPAGWADKKISDLAQVSSGKAAPNRSKDQTPETPFPILGAGNVMGYCREFLFDEKLLVIGRVGTHGVVQRINSKSWPTDNTLIIRSEHFEYLNQILINLKYDEMNRGGVQGLITQTDVKNTPVIFPESETLSAFQCNVGAVMNLADLKRGETALVGEVCAIILSRIATVN